MSEQLELFDEPEFSGGTKGASSQDDGVADSGLPDGYVMVKVGRDDALTAVAAGHAERLGLPALAKSVVVVWNRRMRTAAGRAFFRTGRIELNPKLQTLAEDRREDEIQNTFLHELAHLVSFARAEGRRIQPHGPEWKLACADLGIPGEDRCHELDFAPRKMRRKYGYECPNCGTVVERVRRLKRKVACYDCCKAHAGGRFDSRFVLEEKIL